jgi:AraC family transcriptional regulator, arabinose operon regulatory protein
MDVPKFDRRAVPAQVPRHLPNAGVVTYPPRATLGPRVQPAYQLVLVHTGSARVTVNGLPREIPAGHVGLLLPGTTEFFAFALDRQTRHSWIAAVPAYLDGALCRRLDRTTPCLPLSATMQTCVDLGREVAAVDDPERRPVLAAVAGAALALYVAEATHAATAQRAEHPAVARARELARRRAAEGISVSDLAREVGLSMEHLVRLFRRQTGMTPGALLREERLSHGMHLLQHTGLTVAEVARRSGFVSPHHFARSVRAATGMTPSELRSRSWVAQAWTDHGSA